MKPAPVAERRAVSRSTGSQAYCLFGPESHSTINSSLPRGGILVGSYPALLPKPRMEVNIFPSFPPTTLTLAAIPKRRKCKAHKHRKCDHHHHGPAHLLHCGCRLPNFDKLTIRHRGEHCAQRQNYSGCELTGGHDHESVRLGPDNPRSKRRK